MVQPHVVICLPVLTITTPTGVSSTIGMEASKDCNRKLYGWWLDVSTEKKSAPSVSHSHTLSCS